VIFEPTPLAGAWVIDLDRRADERGWFARTFDADEFAARGLEPQVLQCNASFNAAAGTLRGMHFQLAPREEPKLVRCTRGAVYDVLVDLRPGSETYRQWFGAELSEDNGRMLYVPGGLAHGFQTLADASEVAYQMGERYSPDHATGVRWDDPAFGIEWPEPPAAGRTMSERDAGWPDFAP
jgi:dTDP-4-dehydrorhamnose 3,5-epimerase